LVLPVLFTCGKNSHELWQENTIVTQIITGTGHQHWLWVIYASLPPFAFLETGTVQPFSYLLYLLEEDFFFKNRKKLFLEIFSHQK
jgi:hypothetical protein